MFKIAKTQILYKEPNNMVNKKKLCVFLAILVLLFIIGNLLPLVGCNVLERQYYIGGIISGIFAFCAFAVAVATYLEQTKIADKQRFETTFFSMLSLQEQISNQLVWEEEQPMKNPNNEREIGFPVERNSIRKNGRQVFDFLWTEKWFEFVDPDDLEGSIYYKGLHETLRSVGSEEYTELKAISVFDHYFRHLYRIIKFVDTSKCLCDAEKYEYTSIVRASLSRYELIWLYYNCLFGAGKAKFKPLVEKFSMLKNIREDLLTTCKEVLDKGLSEEFYTNWSDYEEYMTDQENIGDKFHIKAFANHRNEKEYEQMIKFYKDSQTFYKKEMKRNEGVFA